MLISALVFEPLTRRVKFARDRRYRVKYCKERDLKKHDVFYGGLRRLLRGMASESSRELFIRVTMSDV